MQQNSFYFTSESVSEGHPDKIADQISDAVLDAILAKDKNAKVACESYIKTGFVLVGGEITTNTWVDIEELVRRNIKEIGYTHSDMGFDGNSCAVLNAIGKQSQDIAQGVVREVAEKQGAGDQGMMFGYATNETANFMPMPIKLAHDLTRTYSELRKSQKFSWMRPDGKSQVTVHYEDGKPKTVSAVVLSCQHDATVSMEELRAVVMEEVIKRVIPQELLTKETKFFINPTGKFVIGGPMGDCGLTGRKIMVDTYGGMARHGGGAFSGKDPSKVDRSAAYMARYVAKNIVAAKLADRCEIQISYAIGVDEPLSIMANTFGTGKIADSELARAIPKYFDLTPYGIIKKLQLLRPIYKKTATFGHFGRDDNDFTWELIELDLLKGLI